VTIATDSRSPLEASLDDETIKFNFQPSGAPLPESDYLPETGKPFGQNRDRQGRAFGWVTEESAASANPVPAANNTTRNRNQQGIIPRLNTLIHLQFGDTLSPPDPRQRFSWQYDLPPGDYVVTVCVGDPQNIDSIHQINIQNKPIVSAFQPTQQRKFFTITEVVTVQPGQRLTIDAKGGKNTKLAYLFVAPGDRPFVTELTAQFLAEDGTNQSRSLHDGEMNVPTSTSLTPELAINPASNPDGNPGFNNATTQAAKLLLENTAEVPLNPIPITAGNDVLSINPVEPLKAQTQYTFKVTPELKSKENKPFVPKTISFTTGSAPAPETSTNLKFEKIPLPTTRVPLPNTNHNENYSRVVIGPDGKLYASALSGNILRFAINPDGTLGEAQRLTSLQNRAVVGMCFDPSSTAQDLKLWVSHGAPVNAQEGTVEVDAPEWSGKVSRLSGANLEVVQDYVVDLPRSVADHMTTGIAFNPNERNVLYILQGSNTAMGEPGGNWKDRPEKLLSAAALRVDLSKISTPPLSVKTGDGGTYDPFAANAPLTIYASGLRSPYALVFHSNQKLYVTNNGSAGGYTVPSTPNPLPSHRRIDEATFGPYTGPAVKGNNRIPADHDYLFRIDPGGYYGHPNSQRNEWVMNGGNPVGLPPQWTQELKRSTEDFYPRIDKYPRGTNPDRNWRGYAYDFDLHASPTGLIEYKSNKFGGALKGKLIAVCFNKHQNLVVLTPGDESKNWNIVGLPTRVQGFERLDNIGNNPLEASAPLDLVENPKTGDLYIAKLRREPPLQGEIWLLRPVEVRSRVPLGDAVSSQPLEIINRDGLPFPRSLLQNQTVPNRAIFSRVQNPGPERIGDTVIAKVEVHDTVTLQLKNNLSTPIQITQLTIDKPDDWIIPPSLTLPRTIAANSAIALPIKFVAERTGLIREIIQGNLTIGTNNGTESRVELSGLWQGNPEGNNEPTLNEIIRVFGYKTLIPENRLNGRGRIEAIGDEVVSTLWRRANPNQQPTLYQLAAFHGRDLPVMVRWYPKGGDAAGGTRIFEHHGLDAQTLLPRGSNNAPQPSQGVEFNPPEVFGFNIRDKFAIISSDPARNRQFQIEKELLQRSEGHHLRFWKLKDPKGNEIPHTWIMAMDYLGSKVTRPNWDYNDNVYIVTNIAPAT
jgi:glucose/arabinose dehydrogenase